MGYNDTDQWMEEGDCGRCRRQRYCGSECAASKRRRTGWLADAVSAMMMRKQCDGGNRTDAAGEASPEEAERGFQE